MGLNEMFSIMKSITTNIKEMEPLLDVVSKLALKPLSNIIIFPSDKSKKEMLTQLDLLKGKMLKIQEEFNLFEKDANNKLMKLVNLIRSYSRIVSDVNIAKAKADKLSEIVQLAPDVISKFGLQFIQGTRDEHKRIERDINELPMLDNTESGIINAKLETIRDLINELEAVHQDSSKYIDRFINISRNYSDLEGKFSQLLNKILDSFKIPT